MIDRELALRILGLSADADEIEIQNAYRALRAHLQARLAASESAAFREARGAELRDLERVLRALTAVPVPRGRYEPSRARVGRAHSTARSRWILAWAVAATLCSLALLGYLESPVGSFGPAVLVGGRGRGADGAAGGFAIDAASPAPAAPSDPGAPGEVESAGERARIVAHSSVEGAVLQIEARGETPEVVAEGAADETEYWVAPGSYALRVTHRDCTDVWKRDLTVRDGEHHEFAPQLCEQTGWVVVRSNQPEDQLSIDGRKLGPTNPEPHPLPVGEHQVRVEKTGYEPWEGLIDVAPGKVLAIGPRLAPRAAAKPASREPGASGAEASRSSARSQPSEDEIRELGGWHEEAMQWLLARYDEDRSGLLDSEDELRAIPCDQWLGLEQSYDNSGLGLSLTRFYGFDGEGWRTNALGVGDGVRDVAYQRMKECGLR